MSSRKQSARSTRKQQSNRKDEQCSGHSECPEHFAPRSASPRPVSNYLLVLVCFFLSGLAALLYQTAWMRQFAVVFGTSELAVATVLAAYMGGLAAGAAIAGKWVGALRRPVLAYGLLELAIAVGALLVPYWLSAAQSLQAALIGGQSELPDAGGLAQPLFYVTAAFLALILPTGCMGATLPLLTRYAVRSDEQIGTRVGTLYAVNTLGAVVGAAAAAFVLLPHVGLLRTTLWGVAANVGVFITAAFLARRMPTREPEAISEAATNSSPATVDRPGPSFDWLWMTLPVMFVSGMVSFTYEVLWTRLLGHVIGGSTYAFATMLSTFLIGITLGAAFAGRLARGRLSGWLGLTVSQLGIALASIGVYGLIEEVPGLAASFHAGAGAGLAANVGLCALVLLPATLCIGATFPFAVRLLAADEHAAASESARIYAWNTTGGVAGALLAGFWIVPELGFAGTIRLAVGTSMGLAVIIALLRRRSRFQVGIAGTAVSVATLVLFCPKSPDAILGMSPVSEMTPHGALVYQGIGRSSTVRLTDGNGYFLLQNNGLPEAVIGMKGSPPFGGGLSRWLTALPLLARPRAESLLVIGFGSGQLVDTIPASVRRIDVIELEPEVVEANRRIALLRERDPLSDPRLRIVLNDARGALNLSSRRYDIIVSQPSHPWTAGASHLYTQEFMQLARQHLSEGGAFLQWLDSELVDGPLFRSIAATLLSVFRHARLYQPNATALMFVASDQPLALENNIVSGAADQLHSNGFGQLPASALNTLSARLVLDTAGLRALAEGAPINTDDQNLLAFHSSAQKNHDRGKALGELTRPYDAVLDRGSELYADRAVAAALRPSMIIRRMCVEWQWERAMAYAESFHEPGVREMLFGVISRSSGDVPRTRDSLRRALALNPSLNEARFLLCEQYLDELLHQNAPADVADQFDRLQDPERAVIEGCLAMRRNDFLTMERLEPRLRQAAPDQLCYSFALYCRAAWRSAPRPHPFRSYLAQEAIDLVDQALSIWNQNYGYMMRMNASVLANRPVEALETVRQYARRLASADSPTAQSEAREHLQVLRRLLARLELDPRIKRSTWRQVSDFVEHQAQALAPSGNSHLNDAARAILPASYERLE